MAVLKRGDETHEVYSPYEIESLKKQGFVEEGEATEEPVEVDQNKKKGGKRS